MSIKCNIISNDYDYYDDDHDDGDDENDDGDDDEDDNENDDDDVADNDNILLKRWPRTTLYPRLPAYLEFEKQERGVQKTTTPTTSTSEHSWDEPLRNWSKEHACKKNDDNRSPLYKPDTSLRPIPHESGYFWIRKFFFPIAKISTSTRCVFKSNFLVHKYSDSLSFRQLVWKVIFG